MRSVLTAILMLGVLGTPLAHAQAFCELRDPSRVIRDLVPESVSFNSEVLSIDDRTRAAIVDSVGVKMHHQELGYHTLYTVWDDQNGKLGLVHVRPEATPWGLMEIAWMIDLNGRVVDFTLQRCRSQYCEAMNSDKVHAVFYRRDLTSLNELLHERTDNVDRMWLKQLGLSDEQEPLFAAITLSAIKTLAVLEYGGLIGE